MPNKDTKSRILQVHKILVEETDTEHYITIQQIIDKLAEVGISAYRQTILSDIEQLIDAGVDIRCVKSSQNRYYIENGLFSFAELRLLVDAVEASQFITRHKSSVLIDKLCSLTSKYNNDKLSQEIFLLHRDKNDNEEIFEVIERCNEAICNHKQITFLYYEYDVNKNKILRNFGQRYVFSPYGMTWEDGRYYLIGFSVKHDKIITFRVDRMTDVEITNDVIVAMPEGFNIADYVSGIFRMYDDKPVRVTLKCRNELMKSIIDRFGEDVDVEPKKNGFFYAYVDVSVSQTFYGWVFQFGGDIQIVKPASVKKAFKEMGNKVFGED